MRDDPVEQVVGLRPFVPAKDLDVSTRFYEALGFAAAHADASIVILRLESCSFILQKFYVKEFAENLMLQLMVRDVDAWWQRVVAADLEAAFAVRAPSKPSMQPWGLKVGFLFDPAGVLWHVTEAP